MPSASTDLLDAVLRVLARRPTATMPEIATGAGISRATLFRRFPSREALVVALCERALELYTGAIAAAEPERGPAPEALRRVLTGVAALGPVHGVLGFQPLPQAAEEKLAAGARGADARLEALVARGQADGAFARDVPAEWVVAAATWLTVGAADALRLGTIQSTDVERLVAETVLRTLRHGASS